MKKTASLLAAIILLSACLTSCTSRKVDMNTKVRVVTTIFPVYDWTRNLLEEQSNNTLLLSVVEKTGIDYHSYTPEASDLKQIENADLIIYIGGETEKWIEEAANACSNEKLKQINLSNLFEEPVDEHLWLSPKKALVCCRAISMALIEKDPENTAKYQELYSAYEKQLKDLDSDYAYAIENASKNYILLCDRNPFASLTEDYALTIDSSFTGCGIKEDFTPEQIKTFTEKIEQSKVKAVYALENTDIKILKKAVSETSNYMCDVYTLDSMQNTTLAQAFKGKSYINVMNSNLSSLKKSLN